MAVHEEVGKVNVRVTPDVEDGDVSLARDSHECLLANIEKKLLYS